MHRSSDDANFCRVCVSCSVVRSFANLEYFAFESVHSIRDIFFELPPTPVCLQLDVCRNYTFQPTHSKCSLSSFFFCFVCGTAAIRRMRRSEAQLTPIMRPMRAVETASFGSRSPAQSEIKLVEINTTHWCNLSADEDVEKRKGNFAALHSRFTN